MWEEFCFADIKSELLGVWDIKTLEDIVLKDEQTLKYILKQLCSPHNIIHNSRVNSYPRALIISPKSVQMSVTTVYLGGVFDSLCLC